MKKNVIVAIFLLSSTAPMFAQGLVNFANTPTSPVYAQAVQPGGSFSIMSGPSGSYYFGLFLGTFQSPTFTGIYATNTGADGLFSGGVAAVPGWSAGTSTNYFVAGWSGGMGHDFNPIWLLGPTFRGGDFGVAALGTGTAGNGSTIPILNLFDGGPGTLTGIFLLSNSLVPEPSSTALAALGAGVILFHKIRRTKTRRNNEQNVHHYYCSRSLRHLGGRADRR